MNGSVQEGRPIVARRFNAGWAGKMISVPLGTAEMPHGAGAHFGHAYGTLTYSEGDPPRRAPASDRSRDCEPTVQQLATIR